MRFPDLPHEKRLPAASLSGLVGRLTRGSLEHLDRAEKLAAIREVTTDAQVLGHQMGTHLAPEHIEWAAQDAEALSLLRELGADEAEGERMAQWLREEQERRRTQRFR